VIGSINPAAPLHREVIYQADRDIQVLQVLPLLIKFITS